MKTNCRESDGWLDHDGCDGSKCQCYCHEKEPKPLCVYCTTPVDMELPGCFYEKLYNVYFHGSCHDKADDNSLNMKNARISQRPLLKTLNVKTFWAEDVIEACKKIGVNPELLTVATALAYEERWKRDSKGGEGSVDWLRKLLKREGGL